VKLKLIWIYLEKKIYYYNIMNYIQKKNNLNESIFNKVVDKTMNKLELQIRKNKENTLIELLAWDLFRRMLNNTAYLD